jgi:hypothetical protein
VVLADTIAAEFARSEDIELAGASREALVDGLQQHPLVVAACLTWRQANGHLDRALSDALLYELNPGRYKLL